MDEKSVLVIYGKDLWLKGSMFRFLQAIGLNPVEPAHYWQRGTADPHNALQAALKDASVVLILLTGDDEAKTRHPGKWPEDSKEDKLHPPFQPQLHVLFAAGMALAKYRRKTILVQRGHLRPCSDLSDQEPIELGNSIEQRSALIEALRRRGCSVDLSNHKWLHTGDFSDPDSHK